MHVVLAGNHAQFVRWCRENGLRPYSHNVIYATKRSLCGISGKIEVYQTRTWPGSRTSEQIMEIYECIRICKSSWQVPYISTVSSTITICTRCKVVIVLDTIGWTDPSMEGAVGLSCTKDDRGHMPTERRDYTKTALSCSPESGEQLALILREGFTSASVVSTEIEL